MKTLRTILNAIRAMPEGLRLASAMLLFLSICFLSVGGLPNGEQLVQGDRKAVADFLQHGGRILLLAVGTIAAVLVFGFVRACGWARPLAVISGWSITIGSFLSWHEFTLRFWIDFVWTLLWFGFIPIWYLYYRHSVQKYFTSKK